MTEPTLTELRAHADMLSRWLNGEPFDRREFENAMSLLAQSFISLTDQTPLTAEHCREAGIDESSLMYFITPRGAIFACEDDEPGAADLPYATAGTMRLALLQENSDGE